MILAQLLHAFPGSHFSTRAVPGAWEVCVLHGALQPGMSKWLEDHNLTAERSALVDGYMIRWVTSGPDDEKRVFATVKKFADMGFMTAKQRRLFNDAELRGFDRHINRFILAAQELGL